MNEKADACECLGDLAKHCPGCFAPFLQNCFDEVSLHTVCVLWWIHTIDKICFLLSRERLECCYCHVVPNADIINCPVTRADMNEPGTQSRGLTVLISALWRVLRNNGRFLTRTSHSLLRNQRHIGKIVPPRMRANGNFSDASLEWFYSVSINRAMSPSNTVDLELPLILTQFKGWWQRCAVNAVVLPNSSTILKKMTILQNLFAYVYRSKQ